MNDIIEIPEEKKDKGFTLIELLIVIVILGILATVTVFAVGGITDRASENTCEVELATVQTAWEAHFVDTGDYPEAFTDLTPLYLRDLPTNVANFTITGDTVTGDCTP